MKRMRCILILLLALGPAVLHAQEQQDTLDASRITVIREKMRNTTQTGLMHIESKDLAGGVALFGSPDVIKKLQLLPGVAAGNELMSGLYVHGGDGADNLYLLDGVPLYNISHFGGLFSSFNTDIIDNLDFYKSGFPARYGGRMSSVVDVETREGNMERYHGSASLGLIDGRIQVEGPIVKGKTSFNLGLRRSWMEVVTIPAILYANARNGEDQTVGGGYSMSDINARITHRFSPDHVINLCFYTGLDNLRAKMEKVERAVDDAGVSHSGNSNMEIGVKWGSLTASASHQYAFSKKLKEKTILFYSQSISDTGYNFGMWGFSDGAETLTSMDDKDASYVREGGLTSHWDWYPNAFNHVRFGVSAQEHWYHTGRDYTSSTVKNGEKLQENADSEELGYSAFEPAVYAEDEVFLRYNLSVNLGLRYALFAVSGKTWHSLEPRVAAKWMVHPDVSFKLSYTRMSQFAHLVAATYMDLPSNCWMPSTALARPLVSGQVAGGIYTTPFKYFTLNVEGWYKTMDHLLMYSGNNSFVPPVTAWEKSFSEGKGRSYGLELEASFHKGPLSLSAYYTLSWTQRYFEDIYNQWFPDRNDNRHKINLVASWHFAKHWEVFANWNYHSGNRITFPSHFVEEADGSRRYMYDAPYNTQLPDYHRLDLGMDYATTFGNGHSLKINLSIYNAYNHLNASMAFLQANKDGTYSGMAYGLVPIIPTFTGTYSF